MPDQEPVSLFTPSLRRLFVEHILTHTVLLSMEKTVVQPIDQLVLDAWKRLGPRILSNPAEVARRMARRGSKSLSRAPRGTGSGREAQNEPTVMALAAQSARFYAVMFRCGEAVSDQLSAVSLGSGFGELVAWQAGQLPKMSHNVPVPTCARCAR